MVDEGEDPKAILRRIDEMEEQYKDSFSELEYATFYRVRAVARIGAHDHRGALDDLKLSKGLGARGKTLEAISRTIENLEATIASQASQETPVTHDGNRTPDE